MARASANTGVASAPAPHLLDRLPVLILVFDASSPRLRFFFSYSIMHLIARPVHDPFLTRPKLIPASMDSGAAVRNLANNPGLLALHATTQSPRIRTATALETLLRTCSGNFLRRTRHACPASAPMPNASL
ncbi:MAG: hypothetical protein HC945_00910 [Nitrosarchaeum sp.]|nr:hypothetical protein [Nitrosarchaeum sp.]